MVAWVITPTNSTLYICNTNAGAVPYVLVVNNSYQSWGNPITIGGYPGSAGTVSNFNGSICAVAMFTNALSKDQISTLFNAGFDQDQAAPVISIEPVSTAAYRNGTATFSVTAGGVGTLTYQWQISAPGIVGWSNLTDATGIYGRVSGSRAATLVISSVTTNINNATFQVVVTDAFGNATSTPAVSATVFDTANLSVYAE